jgi:hypothetical protein
VVAVLQQQQFRPLARLVDQPIGLPPGEQPVPLAGDDQQRRPDPCRPPRQREPGSQFRGPLLRFCP